MQETNSDTGGGTQLNIPRIVRQLLNKRGIAGEGAVRKFLFPTLADLPDPRLMQDLQPAASLVTTFIESGKKIVVWGDYDVDGTTGTALLVNFFKEIGVKVDWHVPNRLLEGYGLNVDWFKNNSNSLGGDFLLITVDCGISNRPEIEEIKALGGKVIVTDHHEIPQEGIPGCLVLNPSRNSCGFYGEQLAGVGVAFYLAAGVRANILSNNTMKTRAKTINLKRYLAFVALGTIADVVYLTPTNRTMVRAGTEALAVTSFVGLQQLLAACEISSAQLPSEEIGFTIGPKINAAGRLGDSEIAVKLLTEEDPLKAKKLAKKLLDLNRKRRQITEKNLELALKMTSISLINENKCVLFRGDIHPGVAGIVAAKMVDIYGVPALVFACGKNSSGEIMYSGSARSVEGLNLIELLRCCSPWIDKFGGHEMAAGMTIREENFTGFEKLFTALVIEATEKKTVITREKFDLQCSVDAVMNEDCLEFMKFLEPFGPGNAPPVFEDPAVQIVDSKKVGRGAEHLQLTIRGKYASIKGIGFGLAAHIDDIQREPVRKLLYTPTINRFRGTVSWQVRVIDI